MQENIQPQINSNQDDEISLKELVLQLKEWWKYLLSKWLVILIAGVIGGMIGLAYSFMKKPVYIARLTFALEEDKGSGLGSYAGLASQFGIDIGVNGGGAFSGDNLLELMKSRTMIERTLLSSVNESGKGPSLAEYYIDFNRLREKWKDEPELVNVSFPANADRSKFSRMQDSILNTFTESLRKKNISVEKTDKKLSIIAVTCKSEDELFSKSFTEGLVGEVTNFYTKTKTGRSQKSVSVLQLKSDSLRKELDKAMYGRAMAVDQTLNLNPARQTATVPSQRKSADIQVLGTAYGEVVKNLEISKMALMRDTPLIQIIDEPIFPLEKKKVGKIFGVIVGGFLTVFITTLGLIINKLFKKILQ